MSMTHEASGVPPDGGYGWVVISACASSNLVVPPIAAVFGLVVVEASSRDVEGSSGVQLSPGAAALSLCLNAGAARLLRAPAPPLLRALGSRGAALCGTLTAAAGLALTALATTTGMFVLCYGLINSLGIALLTSAFSLALNSFFSENRSIAFGITSSCVTLGTVYMPLLMSALMSGFGWRHALLILAALCLASLISAGMLRPAEWYYKTVPRPQDVANTLNKDASNAIPDIVAATMTITAIPSLARLEECIEDEHRINKTASLATLASATSIQARNDFYQTELRDPSAERIGTENKYIVGELQQYRVVGQNTIMEMTNLSDLVGTVEEGNELQKTNPDISRSLVTDELSHPRFISLLGLSIASSTESVFSLLLPLIVQELLSLETHQVALVLAVRGATEMLYRLLAPSIGEWCHKPPRQIHLIALLMSVFARIMLLLSRSFSSMVLVGVVLGAAAGLRRRRGGSGVERPRSEPCQVLLDGVGVILLGAATGYGRSWCESWRPPVLALCAVTLAAAAAAAAVCGAEHSTTRGEPESREVTPEENQ